MNRKRIFLFAILFLGVGVAVWGSIYFYKNLRGVGPAVMPSQGDLPDKLPGVNQPPATNSTSLPLNLPEGFGISLLAKNLPGARVLALDSFGNLWVSQTSQGKVAMIDLKSGGQPKVNTVFSGLRKPHGLALDGNMLYIAEETSISRVALYSDDSLHKIADLPVGGRHYTRTLGFGPDGRLYVSLGSTCDVCRENDERLAAIYSMNKDGSDFRKVASGLRNSVFFAFSPKDGKLWATEMGRDGLGDEIPPDEINIIENGKNYGWPICYGKNIHDTNFDKNQYFRDPCADTAPPVLELPAHSAPLGITFVPENSKWPQKYWNGLIVAFHGSWNRSSPTGYKLVYFPKKDSGYGSPEDFVSGWLTSGGKAALGRPVDVLATVDGRLLVSDDKAGAVYVVSVLEANPTSTRIQLKNFDAQAVASPVKLEGQAPGSWFFEASFPIEILDSNRRVVGSGAARALGEWMTTEPVNFEASISFSGVQAGSRGWIRFKKDNPSGLPQNDAQEEIAIKFK